MKLAIACLIIVLSIIGVLVYGFLRYGGSLLDDE